MKVEQAREVASKAIEQLRQALESGQSGRLKEYLAAMARFHRYSWHNVMLIAMQKPTATHVAGFHAWHKLGRFVKKGEKGIMILAPVVRRKAENAGQTETDESSTSVGFRAAYVFDVAQTDGQELPEASTAIPASIASAWRNSSPGRASLSNIPRASRPRAARRQAAESRCCPASLPPRSSQRSRMRSRTN